MRVGGGYFESAMVDFEAESIFLTLFQGHLLYYNISPTPNIRHPVIGGGGGVEMLQSHK